MAYPVSNDFKTKLYSGESDFRAILTINGTTIPEEQIASISISSPIIDNTNSMFYMGSFISQKITIHFNNMEGINVASGQEVSLTIGQYVNNAWEDVPIGVFLVDDLSEDYYQKCEINCLDYAIKFKPNIDYSPCFTDGKATIDTILAYICNYFNVTLGEYPSINGDVEIGTYDASISGKQWISYIAEIKGCNAKMDRNGALTLKPIKSTSVETIDATSGSELTLGEAYNISRVCYYDAIRKYEYGDNSGNTLYIRQDNPFINEGVVANIYEQVLTQPSSSEGTNFELSGLSSLPISVAEIEGDTYQEQTEASRNLLTIPDITNYTSNGITFSFSKGVLTYSGTATSNFAYIGDYVDFVLPVAQYTFSTDQVIDSATPRITIKYGSSSSTVQTVSKTTFRKTFTTVEQSQQVRLGLSGITSGNTYNGTLKLQLEQNSTSTEWVEPEYAKPSPNNPSEVQVVTGGNVIKIYDKNLLDLSNAISSGSNNGITLTKQSDNSYKYVGTATSSAINVWLLGAYGTWNNYSNWGTFDKGLILFTLLPGKYVFKDMAIFYIYEDGTKGSYNHVIGTNEPSVLNFSKKAYVVAIRAAQAVANTQYDTIAYPMIERGETLSEYKKCEPQTYEINLGKNLVDFANPTGQTGTYSFVDDTLTFTGTPTATYRSVRWNITDLYKRNAGKTLTMSYESLDRSNFGGGTIGQINVDHNDGTATKYLALINSSGTIQNVTIPENTTNIRNVQFSIYDNNTNTSGSYSISITKPMLIFKTLAFTEYSYERYKEPIELCKIGDYQDRIFRTSGRNLIQNNLTSRTVNGVTATVNNDGSITFTGTPTDGVTFTLNTNTPNLEEGEQYILSCDCNLPAGGYFRICDTIDTSQLYTLGNRDSVDNRQYITFTYSGNFTSGTFRTFVWFSTYAVGTSVNLTVYPMLVKSSSRKTYEPYGSGKWYLNKNVGKYNITGNEQWTLYDITEKPVYYIDTTIDTQKIDYAQQLGTLCYCDYLKGGQQVANFNDVYDMGNYSIAFRTTYKRLVIRYDTTLSNLTTWLSNTKPFVLYPLATPTYTEITNTELIEQLENIQNISPYNGYANISITTSNLTPTLKLNYTTSDNLDLQSLTTRNIGDFSLDAWDTITYDVDGTTYRALNNNEIKYEQNIMGAVNPKFPTGQQEETTNVVEESVNSLKLKVSTEIDNVNGAIALKVDKDGVINSINLSTEGTQIEGGKISLAGKTIEMTSDDITINSNNFQVDAEGNVNCTSSTMTNSTINGGKLTLYDIGQNDPSIEIYENERENSLTIGNTYDLYSVVLNTLSSGIFSGNDRIARNGTIVAFTTNEYLYKYVLTCKISYSQVSGQTYQEVIYEYKSNLADTQTLQVKRIWFYSETMSTSQQLGIDQKEPTIINENVTCTIYDTTYSDVLNKMHFDMTTNNLQTKIASGYILGKELMLQDSSEQNYFFMVTPTTGQIMTNCLAQFDDIFLSNSTNEIRITPNDIKYNDKSIIKKSNITMGLSSDATISNTTETKISLSRVAYTGSGLTDSGDGGVLVGANISAIMVSGQANISAYSGNALRTFFIKRDRNGTLTNIARVNFRLNATYTGTYNTMQITPKITGVEEGDKIYLYAQHQNPSSGTSSTTVYGSNIDTYITVQELE